MSGRAVLRLDARRKIGLALAGAAALAVPFVVGIMDAPARGQSSDVAAQAKVITVPQFDVASIKPHRSGTISFSMRPTPGGGLVYTNVTLRDCIQAAYGVRDDQISGGPGWICSDRFDIVAKAASPVPDSQVMLMLRSLLEDRFKLTIHRDTKTLPLYRLVVAKGGPKVHEVEEGETSIRGDRGKLTAQKISMRQLADFLARRLNAKVIDSTGLNGVFDVRLDWTPDANETTGKPTFGPAEQPTTTGPSLFTALQDQLGLRLQADKGPAEVIIIDKAEKPSEN
jgi:uncharacterized protein (TIGR03435 family)